MLLQESVISLIKKSSSLAWHPTQSLKDLMDLPNTSKVPMPMPGSWSLALANAQGEQNLPISPHHEVIVPLWNLLLTTLV
jgi:hypothetical protein